MTWLLQEVTSTSPQRASQRASTTTTSCACWGGQQARRAQHASKQVQGRLPPRGAELVAREGGVGRKQEALCSV